MALDSETPTATDEAAAAMTTTLTEPAVEAAVPAFEPAVFPWDEMVLVCVKCCNKLGPSMFGDDGHPRLRSEIKSAARSVETPRRIRVTDVQCLGVCPTGRVTVGTFQSTGEMTLRTVAPDLSGDVVLDHLRETGALAPIGAPRP